MRFLAVLFLLALPANAEDIGPLPLLNFAQDFAPGMAGFPRPASDDQAAQRIAARMAATEEMMREADCRDDGGDFGAETAVALNRGGLLSLTWAFDYYCPGLAHPWAVSGAETFNLATGETLDISRLLPRSLRGDAGAPAHLDLYLASLPPDADTEGCTNDLRNLAPGFLAWPDAASQSLVLLPQGLPHILTPCKNEARIPLPRLLALRFPPRLIAALAL